MTPRGTGWVGVFARSVVLLWALTACAPDPLLLPPVAVVAVADAGSAVASLTPPAPPELPAGTPSAPALPAPPDIAAAAPAATAGTFPQQQMAPAVPVRVRLPALGINSTLMDLGLNPDGSLEVPPGAFPAGWYTGAPTPGEVGPAVIAGHVDWAGGPGVFHDLADIALADEILVDRADGTVAVFHVTSIETANKDSFPTDRVYGDTTRAEVRLITCGGDWDSRKGSYKENTIVFAELVAEGTWSAP